MSDWTRPPQPDQINSSLGSTSKACRGVLGYGQWRQCSVASDRRASQSRNPLATSPHVRLDFLGSRVLFLHTGDVLKTQIECVQFGLLRRSFQRFRVGIVSAKRAAASSCRNFCNYLLWKNWLRYFGLGTNADLELVSSGPNACDDWRHADKLWFEES